MWPKEFEALERNVDADAKVVVRFVNDVVVDNGVNGADASDAFANAGAGSSFKLPPRPPSLVYDPPLCFECAQLKLEEKKRQMEEFESKTIFVRKLGDRETSEKLEDDDDAFKISTLTSSSSSSGGVNGHGGGGGGGGKFYENDPEFQPNIGDLAAVKKRPSVGGEGIPDAKKQKTNSTPILPTLTNGHGDQILSDIQPATKQENGLHALNGDSSDFSQV